MHFFKVGTCERCVPGPTEATKESSLHQSQTSNMPFLGCIHDTQGMKMDEYVDEALTSFPQPCSVNELQRFFYHRYIPEFSSVDSSLTSLKRENQRG